eukprot:gene4156-biopygen4951
MVAGYQDTPPPIWVPSAQDGGGAAIRATSPGSRGAGRMRGVGIVGNAARIKTVIAAPHGTVCRDRSRSRRCGAARCGVAAARGARSQRPVGQVAGHTAAAAVAPGGRRCARGYASAVVPTVAPWLRAVRAPSPGLDLHQVADQYSRRGGSGERPRHARATPDAQAR